MKENKNNKLQADALESVAGGEGVEDALKAGETRSAYLKAMQEAAIKMEKESEDFLAQATKLREKEEALRKSLDKVIDFFTFGQGHKWFK